MGIPTLLGKNKILKRKRSMNCCNAYFTVRQLIEGAQSIDENKGLVPYSKAMNPDEFGIVSMDGKLSVRPIYQRNFIWNKDYQRDLIDSINKKWPIPHLTFHQTKDGNWECVDGQQRITTLIHYASNQLLYNGSYFNGLDDSTELRNKFLDYVFEVKIIEFDSDEEKLEYFEAINKPSTQLTSQEVRNATYCGPFVESLKDWFGRNKCNYVKSGLANKFTRCDIGRQELVETVLLWAAVLTDDEFYTYLHDNHKDHLMDASNPEVNKYLKKYMSAHRYDTDCSEVRTIFENINGWIDKTFGGYECPEMKNVKNWAYLYRTYKDYQFVSRVMRSELEMYMDEELIHHKHSVPEYLLYLHTHSLTDDEKEEYVIKHLSFDSFPKRMKKEAYSERGGICECCGKHLPLSKLDAHHIVPWSCNGPTTMDNLQLLCKECHGKVHNCDFTSKRK